jgi:hypothetical protein
MFLNPISNTNYTDFEPYTPPPLPSDADKIAIINSLTLAGFNISPDFVIYPSDTCTARLTRRSPIDEKETPQEAAIAVCAAKPGIGPMTISLIQSEIVSIGRAYNIINGLSMSEWFMARINNPFGLGEIYIPLLLRRVLVNNEWTTDYVVGSELPFAKSELEPISEPEPIEFISDSSSSHVNMNYNIGNEYDDADNSDTPKDKMDAKIIKRKLKVKAFDKLLSKCIVKQNVLSIISTPQPLRRSPNTRWMNVCINKTVQKARKRKIPLEGIYGSFVYYNDTYYMYNHRIYGWVFISLDYQSVFRLYLNLRSRLFDIINRENELEKIIEYQPFISCKFMKDKYILTKHNMIKKFGNDTKGKYAKMYKIHNQKYYLVHNYDDTWVCVNLSQEQVQMCNF